MDPLSTICPKIINYTVDGSIGMQPGSVIFGDMVDSDLSIDLYGTFWSKNNPENCLMKIREAQSILVQFTQDYLKKRQRKEL